MFDGFVFDLSLGFPVPVVLKRFYMEVVKYHSGPLRFEFGHVCYTLEVQYFHDMGDITNYRLEDKLFSFASSTDGFELLINVKENSLNILQDEFGDVDELDLTVTDLLNATIQTQW